MNATDFRSGRFAAASLAALSAFSAFPAAAQFGELYTFTSGNPPIGDGNVYPRSLNPARQAPGGGARPSNFPTNGLVDFFNLNGNPAFFDANNFVTRPASLIQNEAFWTDPKIGTFNSPQFGTFDIALIGFTIYDLEASQFGFDLAVASAAGTPLPGALDFQIQTSTDAFGFGELLLTTDAGGFDGSAFAPVEAGTFFTVGGRQGFEGRYRMDMQDLLGLLIPDDFDGDFDDSGDPGDFDIGSDLLFDIDLKDLVSPGGTTQIAFDNVILNDPDIFIEAEPVILPPLPPVGPNRPQYTVYAEVEDPPTDGDINDFSGDFDSLAGTEAYVETSAIRTLDDVGARAFTEQGNVIFTADSPDDGLYAHEMTHVLGGDGPDLRSNEQPLDPEEQAALQIENLILQNDGGFKTGDSPSPQIVQVTTNLNGKFNENAPTLEQIAREQEVTPVDAPDDTQFQLNVTPIENGESSPGSNGFLINSLRIDLADATEITAAMYYQGYTPQQYLDAVGDDGPQIGDMGSYLTPTFGPDGEQDSWRVSTWIVSDQSAVFTPVVVNLPESAACIGLGLVAGFMARRRTVDG